MGLLRAADRCEWALSWPRGTTIETTRFCKVRLEAQLALLLVWGVLFSSVAAAAGSDVADAVMRQDQAQLNQLIAAKADVNSAQPDGSTALHWAAYHGDTRALSQLLKAGANPNVRTATGMTPLLLACEAGNADLIRLLLGAHADPSLALSHGETPLMMAARTGNVQVMKALIERGVKVDAKEQLRGTTALMWAAANSNAEAVRFLISKGADVSTRSATTKPGREPYLAPSSRDRINEFIHGYGLAGITVDQDAPDPTKGTQKERDVQAAKHKKLEEQRAAAAKVLDQHPGDDEHAHKLDKQWGGLTPLIFATRQGDLETVKVLLEAKADINQTSEFGWTPLLVATQNRYYKLGLYLLDHGANPNIAERGWLESALSRHRQSQHRGR